MKSYTPMTAEWLKEQVSHYPKGMVSRDDDPYGDSEILIGGVTYLSGSYDSWEQFAVFNLSEYAKEIASQLIEAQAKINRLQAEVERLKSEVYDANKARDLAVEWRDFDKDRVATARNDALEEAADLIYPNVPDDEVPDWAIDDLTDCAMYDRAKAIRALKRP